MSGHGRPSTKRSYPCPCGKEFAVDRWYYEMRLRRSKSGRVFCGVNCPKLREILPPPPRRKPRDVRGNEETDWSFLGEIDRARRMRAAAISYWKELDA